MLGPERPLLLSREDRERIAYHESGHAILGLVVPGADPVQRVTIVPRGQALGVTYQRPQTDRYNYPEAYLRARIVGMLGGRAAEEVVYGTRTTGAENDIEQATQLARKMVTRWGMSDELGMVQLAPRENPYLATAGGFGGEQAVQRADRATHRRRGAADHRREPRAGEGAAASRIAAQLDALVQALLAARDARRAGDPRGHRPAAGAVAVEPAAGARDRLNDTGRHALIVVCRTHEEPPA